MKQVILIGDSIRIGYQPFVVTELTGAANVSGPDENGGTSRNVLAHLEEWAIARQPDVIHLNAGLHDIHRDDPAAPPWVGLEEYRANLATILRALRHRTRAQIIYATTTPVNEAWHQRNKPFARLEADVVVYNEVAWAVCREQGVPVNDLYATVMAAGRDAHLLSDGVHYTEAGYRLLGQAVASALRPYLL